MSVIIDFANTRLPFFSVMALHFQLGENAWLSPVLVCQSVKEGMQPWRWCYIGIRISKLEIEYQNMGDVSARNDVWGTTAQNPYRSHFTTQTWVMFLFGWSQPIRSPFQIKSNNKSSVKRFLCSFFRRHFADKTVVVPRFLRLAVVMSTSSCSTSCALRREYLAYVLIFKFWCIWIEKIN